MALHGIVLSTCLAPWAICASSQSYSFFGESTLTDSCPVCARVDIVRPMRGTFELRLLSENIAESLYAVEDMTFETLDGLYRGAVHGTLRILRGEGIGQQWALEGDIFDPEGSTFCVIAQTDGKLERVLPVIRVKLEQTNGSIAQQYLLTINAAPFAGLWFSTANGFTPDSGDGYITGGSMLSDNGSVVRSNAELLAAFDPAQGNTDPGLDALEVLPGGIVAFSVNDDFQSQSLGLLRHGDLLLDDGRVLRRNAELLAAFVLQPPVDDFGLDAVQILSSGEILFSLTTNAFSEQLGETLAHGSLLSDQGHIVSTNRQLLERFTPSEPEQDYGLDAAFQWPHGEIWFSLTSGFQDSQLGAIWPGDLLSNSGYVVARGLDLVTPFRPIEDLADFQTDALVLFGLNQPSASAQFVSIMADGSSGAIALEWTGGGQAFQLFRAPALDGPYSPLNLPGPDRSFLDSSSLLLQPEAFYRLRQW